MKNFATTSIFGFFLFFTSTILAQNNWAWVRSFGQSQTFVSQIAINQNNDIAVLGNTTGIQIIDGTVYNNVPFLSTLSNTNGELLEPGINLIDIECNTSCQPCPRCKIIYDEAGNYYIKKTLSIQKNSATNVMQWNAIFTMNGDQEGNLIDFAIDANGNAFVLATFSCFNVYINGTKVIDGSADGAYLFKIDNFGGFHVWNIELNGTGEVLTTSDNYVIVSIIGGTSDYILKINQAAQIVAKATLLSGGIGSIPHLSIDEDDNIYVGADFSQSVQFSQNQALINTGLSDYFVAKYDDELGTPIWITHLGSTSDEHIDDLAYSQGNVVFSNNEGKTQVLNNCQVPSGNGGLLIRSLNSSTGDCTHYERVTSPAQGGYVFKIISDNQGNFYFSGITNDELIFGDTSVGLDNAGFEPYVAKFNPNGISQASNLEIEKSLSIFPNPSRGLLSISTHSSKPFMIEVNSVEGLLLSRQEISNNQQMDISDLESGVYFVKIRVDEQTTTRKIIVIK